MFDQYLPYRIAVLVVRMKIHEKMIYTVREIFWSKKHFKCFKVKHFQDVFKKIYDHEKFG